MTNPATPASAGTHRVVTGAIDVNALVAQVARPGAGGIATFLGVVRDHSLGRKVLYLFYEAYPPMAIKEMEQLEAEVRERWEIEAIAIVHRVGRLEIGEASVGIAVSAPHRREAIEACHYAIDRLKQTVPVWKKEYWEGGEVWIENAQGSTITRAQA
ncbi:MAG TPA: molybdenum cofactor biosynthesis protein MoaE [bacterium]|jgi:molybdopterin synthase catalytic subunit